MGPPARTFTETPTEGPKARTGVDSTQQKHSHVSSRKDLASTRDVSKARGLRDLGRHKALCSLSSPRPELWLCEIQISV